MVIAEIFMKNENNFYQEARNAKQHKKAVFDTFFIFLNKALNSELDRSPSSYFISPAIKYDFDSVNLKLK